MLFQYYLDPPQRLQEELRKNGLSDMQFFLLKHGESRLIEIKEADDKQDEDEQADDDHHHHEHHAGEEQQQTEEDQGLIDYLVDKMTGEEEKAEDDQ